MTGSSELGPVHRLYADWLARRAAEDADRDFDALCQAHPDQAPELRAVHADYLRLEAALAGLLPSETPGAGGPPALGAWLAFLGRLNDRRGFEARYRRLREIDRGGMGVIDEVWDEDLRRSVAMKRLRTDGAEPLGPDPRLVARFLDEARIAARLEHPGIVPIHDVGIDPDGKPYFTMKLVEGETFAAVLRRVERSDPSWSLARAVGVLLKVCEALAYAHDRGVVHRDLKPENVMVGPFGETYVMDWGLARTRGRRGTEVGDPPSGPVVTSTGSGESPFRTRRGQQLGTPAYMAPEQAQGRLDIDARSDLYSLGAILYRLLAGRAPYTEAGNDALAVLEAVRSGPPRSLGEVRTSSPGELVSVSEKAMARERDERYADASELASDLRAWLEGRVVRAHRTGVVVEFRKWVARNRALTSSLALAALLGLTALGVYTSGEVLAREKDLRQEVTRSIGAARLADQSGEWGEALEYLARARETGRADEAELCVLEAAAHLALSDLSGARDRLQHIEELGLEPPPEAVLLDGRLRINVPGEAERARVLLVESRRRGLSPPDDAFAGALLAPDTLSMIEALDRTVALNPFHREARSMRVVLLAMLGRGDEAKIQADLLSTLYPRDTGPGIARSIIAASRGDEDELETILAGLSSRLGTERTAALRKLTGALVLFGRLSPDAWNGTDPTGHLQIAPEFVRAAEGLDEAVRLVLSDLPLPNLDLLVEAWRTALTILVQITGVPTNSSPDLYRRLDTLANAHPDAFFHYLRGCLAFELASRAEAFRLFQRAIETPSLIPGSIRAARWWLIREEFENWYGSRQPSLAEPLVERITEFAQQYDLTQYELTACRDFAFTIGHTEVSRDVNELHLHRHPDDADALLKRIVIWRHLGCYERAIESADQLLARDPDDAEAQEQRQLAIEAALEFQRSFVPPAAPASDD